jgi:hypothetical protein
MQESICQLRYLNFTRVFKVAAVKNIGEAEHGGQSVNLDVTLPVESGFVVPAYRMANTLLVAGEMKSLRCAILEPHIQIHV